MQSLLRRAVALVWTLCILAMTLLPASGNPDLFEHQDKVAHFVSFAGFGLAWTWARVPGGIVLVTGVLLAVVTEYGQGLVPWPRTPEAADFVFDLAGLVVGQVAAWWMFVRRRRSRSEVVPLSKLKNKRAPRGNKAGDARPTGTNGRSRRDSNPR